MAHLFCHNINHFIFPGTNLAQAMFLPFLVIKYQFYTFQPLNEGAPCMDKDKEYGSGSIEMNLTKSFKKKEQDDFILKG